MRTFSARSLVFAIIALMLSGCAAVVVVGAGGAGGYLTYAFRGDDEIKGQTASTGEPDQDEELHMDQVLVEPADADPWAQPTVQDEELDMGEPVVLVEPRATVEAVEAQPIQ